MRAPPAESVYASLVGEESVVLSHAITKGYTLSRSRYKKQSVFWVISGKYGWFVLMLAGTRPDGNASQMSRESVAVQHAVASVHLPSQSKGIQ